MYILVGRQHKEERPTDEGRYRRYGTEQTVKESQNHTVMYIGKDIVFESHL